VRFGAAVAVVLVLALLLRLWGIRSGLPWIYNIDEADHFVNRAVMMAAGNLRPTYTDNPPAFTYLLVGLYHLAYGGRAGIDRAFYAADPSQIWLLGRIAAAALGTIATWLLYLAGARLFDRRTGLVAAAVIAVAFLPVYYGKLALNDAPALAGVCLSLWGTAGVARAGRGRDYVLAGLGLGLAAATKYTGGIVALPLIVAGLSRLREDGARRALAWLAASGVLALAAFIAADPYSVIDWHAFTKGIAAQSSESAAAGGKLGQAGGGGIRYYLWSLTWGVGWAPAIVALCGAVALALRDRRAFLVLVPAAVAYLLFMGLQARYFGRWLMPIVPIVCLLAARAVVLLAEALGRRRRAAAAATLALAAAGLCAQGAVASVRSGVVNSRVDTRTVALAWLDGHVPARERIVVEPFVPASWSGRFSGYPIYHRTSRLPDGRLAVDPHQVVSIEDYERTLSPALVGLYQRDGYCWVVTASTVAGRAVADPRAVPAALAYYRVLAANSSHALRVSPYGSGAAPVAFNFDWSFDYYPAAYARPGPLIDVYHLRGGRCGSR
jgi:4-amino-4-deoxy-L-arabinose transferase-like glycosyltransferase